MMRKDRRDDLHPVTWDDVLDRVADRLKAIRDEHGGSAVGAFSCSKATNEMNFVAQKFMRVVMGSNNIDSCNRT
jgi:formate dehydrogenase major subunit